MMTFKTFVVFGGGRGWGLGWFAVGGVSTMRATLTWSRFTLLAWNRSLFEWSILPVWSRSFRLEGIRTSRSVGHCAV